MAVWDDIKKKVKEGVSFAAEKTEEYTKIGKLKVDIHNQSKSLDKSYEDMGRLVYEFIKENKKSDLLSDADLLELIGNADGFKDSIKEKEEEIEQIKAESDENIEKIKEEANTASEEAEAVVEEVVEEAPEPKPEKKRSRLGRKKAK